MSVSIFIDHNFLHIAKIDLKFEFPKKPGGIVL